MSLDQKTIELHFFLQRWKVDLVGGEVEISSVSRMIVAFKATISTQTFEEVIL